MAQHRGNHIVFFLLCALLVILGITLIWKYPSDWPERELVVAVSHAFMIAGLLAVTVDRFVKERLLQEITRDVSKYLIGYQLPNQIQDKIHELMATAIVRTRFEQRYRLIPLDDGMMRVEVEMSYDLENFSSSEQRYTPHLWFRKHEKAKMIDLGCHSNDSVAHFHQTRHEIAIHEGGDSIRYGDKIIIVQPRGSGITYRVFARFELNPADQMDIVAFAQPTMDVTIISVCPVGFVVRPEGIFNPTISTGNRWEWKKLFMPAEHIVIKWSRSPSQ